MEKFEFQDLEVPAEVVQYKNDNNKIKLNKGQLQAVESFKQFMEWESESPRDNCITLSGYGGTGKTTTIKHVLPFLGRVMICAPTHKALNVIRDMNANGGEFSTLAKLYGNRYDPLTRKWKLEPKEEALKGITTMLIDESSMVDKEMADAIIAINFKLGIKTIFMGDPAQIPPVGSKNISKVFDADEVSKVLELTEIMRQSEGNPNLEMFTRIRENLKEDFNDFKTNIIEVGEEVQGIFVSSNSKQKLQIIEKLFSSVEFKESYDYIRIICYTNRKVEQMNRIARKAFLGKDVAEQSPFVNGDLLISYKQIAEDCLLQNAREYVVNSSKKEEKTFAFTEYIGSTRGAAAQIAFSSGQLKKTFPLMGCTVNVREENIENKNYGFDIFVPDANHAKNAPFFKWLFNLHTINSNKKSKPDDRKQAYRTLVNVFKEVQLMDTLYIFEDAIYTLTKLRKDFPDMFVVDEFGRSEIDDYIEKGKLLTLEKNVYYGYAITAHKAQGSTYQNVIVDIKDINNPYNERKIYHEGEFYALERTTIKYVACSRTRKINYIFK